MTLEYIRDILEVAYYAAAIIGIPVGIVVFLLGKKRERENREIDIYLQSYDRYLTYLQMTLQYPSLECGEFRGDDKELLDSGLTVEQATMYSVLTMVLEQTYFLYKKSHLSKNSQFGYIWLEYIKWWAARPDFQKAWKIIDPWLEPELIKFIEAEMTKAQKKGKTK